MVMQEQEKSQFKAMMKALTQLYGKQEFEQELLRIWWHKLYRFDFQMVSKAFDSWVDTNKRMPTPADILEICRSHESKNIPVMIGRKFTQEEKDANHRKLQEVLSKLNLKRIA
jgi:hypothetical protein